MTTKTTTAKTPNTRTTGVKKSKPTPAPHGGAQIQTVAEASEGQARPQTPTDTPTPTHLPTAPIPSGKLGLLTALLRREGGASVEQMCAATGWQAHSVRGAMAGSLKKKFALAISSRKTEVGRVYRIEEGGAQ